MTENLFQSGPSQKRSYFYYCGYCCLAPLPKKYIVRANFRYSGPRTYCHFPDSASHFGFTSWPLHASWLQTVTRISRFTFSVLQMWQKLWSAWVTDQLLSEAVQGAVTFWLLKACVVCILWNQEGLWISALIVFIHSNDMTIPTMSEPLQQTPVLYNSHAGLCVKRYEDDRCLNNLIGSALKMKRKDLGSKLKFVQFQNCALPSASCQNTVSEALITEPGRA